MKLIKGQRWRCKSPQCLIEITEADSRKGIVVEIYDSSFNYIGYETNWALFPEENLIENNYWEYLQGQDKPEKIDETC